MNAEQARAEVVRKFGHAFRILWEAVKDSPDGNRAVSELHAALCVNEIMGDYQTFRICQLENMVRSMSEIRNPDAARLPEGYNMARKGDGHHFVVGANGERIPGTDHESPKEAVARAVQFIREIKSDNPPSWFVR